MSLSEPAIRAAQPGETLKDEVVKGLQLRVFPQSKTFYLYYRTKAGVQRKPKLGEWGQLTLTQARSVARQMLMEVAAGGDPSARVAQARAEPTMTDLWQEYWKRHVCKIKSKRNYVRAWVNHVEPRVGKLKVKEVTYSMIADMHEELSIKTPTEANRALAFVSAMFNFAIAPLEWTAKNPAEGVKRNKEVKRKRYMKGEEAARIAEIMHRKSNQYPRSVAFLYLLILTGARFSEIAKAKWGMLEGNRLVLTEHKTDGTGEDRHIYLPPAAMDVLEKLPKNTATITGVSNLYKFWNAVRIEAGCPDLRMHDLRHSFASAAISAGLTLAQIGELLGHKSPQTTHRYAHLVDEAATAAANATADQIVMRMKRPVPA